MSHSTTSYPRPPGKPAPARPPIQCISQWSERFCLMARILPTKFPEKAPEFFAYHASIIRVERNYEKHRWVAYDRQYRREALARKDLNWSAENSWLYNEAFTGRAKAIPRCAYCLQDYHVESLCPVIPTNWSSVGFQTHPIGQPTLPRSMQELQPGEVQKASPQVSVHTHL